MIFNKKGIYLAVLIAVAGALLLTYCYKIDAVPFIRVDDGGLLEVSRTFALHGYLGSRMLEAGHNESRYFHIHPPFFYLLNGLLFKLIGFGILQGRVLALLASFLVLLTVPWLYRSLARFQLATEDAWLLAIMFLSNPFYFIMARYVRPEMPTLLLSLLAILAYLRSERSKGSFYLLLGGLLAGLAVLTHFYGIYALIYLMVCWLFSRKEGKLARAALILAGFILPLVPYLIWLFSDFNSFYFQVIVVRKSLESFNFGGILLRYAAFFVNYKTLNATLLFLAGMLWAVADRRRMTNEQWRTIGRILGPALCFLPIFIVMPRMSEYYYLVLLPFVYFTVIYLKQIFGRPVSLLIGLFIVINLSGLGFYWHKYHDYDYYRYAGKLKAVLPRPGDFAVAGNMSLYPGLLEYKFYAFENSSLAPDNDCQTYAGFARRIKELNIKYIIYQESHLKQHFHAAYLGRYLSDHCRVFGKVNDPGYGSEGQKRDNQIVIYQVIK